MIYKMLPKQEGEAQIFARIDDDGKCRLTCTKDYPEFQSYIANGAELQDADGNVVADAQDFIRNLP